MKLLVITSHATNAKETALFISTLNLIQRDIGFASVEEFNGNVEAMFDHPTAQQIELVNEHLSLNGVNASVNSINVDAAA